MSYSCFTYSSTDEHLGCFHILMIVNNPAMNIEGLMFLWISVLVSFGYILRSGIFLCGETNIVSFLFVFYCCFCTVVSIFPPPLSPAPPTPTSHPQSYPPLALSFGALYMFLNDPSPSFYKKISWASFEFKGNQYNANGSFVLCV